MVGNNSGSGKRTNKSGFTLIEVIAVLVLIGIISAYVVVRATGPSPDLVARTESLKSHLRYAQMKSMSSNNVWGISAAGNSYWLFTNGDTTQSRQLPGEDGLNVNFSDYHLSVSPFICSFEPKWGSPCSDAPATARLTVVASINVSDGTESKSINITPYTGFIP
ncbi:MAG: type II secretion system protein [Syntrophobacterales bacterium]|nr:type II secretion system protein [Syntrophobacterales bacterium]